MCVYGPKAILLTAAARAAGVPARVGFADVRNHLATPKLLDRMGTDLFVFHGYCEMYIDGTENALLQPFDIDGRRHMEYVNDRGTFDDVPFEEMMRVFDEIYGRDFGATSDGIDPIFSE